MKPEHDEALVEQRLLNFTTCGCGDDEWPQLRHDVLALIRTTDAARIKALEGFLSVVVPQMEATFANPDALKNSESAMNAFAGTLEAGRTLRARTTLRSNPDAG